MQSNYGFKGLLFVQENALFYVKDTLFDDNFSLIGGVLFNQNYGRAEFHNSIFTKNKAHEASLIYSINSLGVILISGG